MTRDTVYNRQTSEETMQPSLVEFRITNLEACVTEDLVIEWEGQELKSGPLRIQLDEPAAATSQGFLDYDSRHAHADFHVLLTFPELADVLETAGVDPALTRPLHAVIHAEGEILNDHSFKLSGPCTIADHALLNPAETSASVSPGT
jgi:hypothetical protein